MASVVNNLLRNLLRGYPLLYIFAYIIISLSTLVTFNIKKITIISDRNSNNACRSVSIIEDLRLHSSIIRTGYTHMASG